MRTRYPENVPGPFYVENDLCLICMAPEHEAPDLMGFFDGGQLDAAVSHCYFKKQPETPAETKRAINAMRVACCGALRYGGDDQEVINRLLAAGVDSVVIDDQDQTSVLSRIRKGVEAEYSERLANAGWVRRMWLRRMIKAEIERRVQQEIHRHRPSDDALFLAD